MNKTIVIVSHCNRKDARGFETKQKEKYLLRNKGLRLVFFHEEDKPQHIYQKIKEKRAKEVVFADVPVSRIKMIYSEVKKRMNGSTPTMSHMIIGVHIDGVNCIHKDDLQSIFSVQN